MSARPRWLREALRDTRRPVVHIATKHLTDTEFSNLAARWQSTVGRRVKLIVDESGATVTRLA